jgi:hypothetical protein
VRKIQAALITLDRANIDVSEIAHEYYGPFTAKAVLAYKKKQTPPIIGDYQRDVDDIVGKMTIKSLDDAMKAKEDGRRDPPTPPFVNIRAQFTPRNRLQGFDPAPTNPSVPGEAFQAVPLGDHTRVVRLIGGGNSTAAGLKVSLAGFLGRNALDVASFVELTSPAAPDRLFQIRGGTRPGGARLEARNIDGTLAGALQIAVLPEKRLSLAFHVLADSAGHRTQGVGCSNVPEFLKTANRIWAQANVILTPAGCNDLQIPGNGGNAANEALIIRELSKLNFGGTIADRHVVFVWDLQDDSSRTTVGDTPLFGPITFIDETVPPNASTLAHEIGHSLSLKHESARGDTDNLMIDESLPTEKPTLLNKEQILTVNPPAS